MQAPIIIVGGGLAGLACASHLIQQNMPVILFEASDRVGGRVRTDIVEGYRIDRGFQVISEAYPALTKVVSMQEIGPRRFDAGAVIWDGKTQHRLISPFSEPKALPGVMRSHAIPLRDKLKLAKLAASCRMAKWETAAAASVSREGSQSALALFEEAGFSSRFITRFAKPFWGGISLDPTLSLSAGPVLYTLKMFTQGAAVIPEAGMQALPDAMAERHPDALVRLSTPIDTILIENGRATGVVAGGESIQASAVVIATDGPAAKALTGIESIPADGIGCTTVYLAGSRDPGIGKSLLLNGSGFGGVNHIAPLSNVAPSYAPRGKHLIAAVLLESPDLRGRNQESIVQLARADAARMLGQNIEDWELVSTVTVPFSQFRQPPGFVAHLPRNRTETLGLYLAGEYTVDASHQRRAHQRTERCHRHPARSRRLFCMSDDTYYKGEFKTPGGKLVGVRFSHGRRHAAGRRGAWRLLPLPRGGAAEHHRRAGGRSRRSGRCRLVERIAAAIPDGTEWLGSSPEALDHRGAPRPGWRAAPWLSETTWTAGGNTTGSSSPPNRPNRI